MEIFGETGFKATIVVSSIHKTVETQQNMQKGFFCHFLGYRKNQQAICISKTHCLDD